MGTQPVSKTLKPEESSNSRALLPVVGHLQYDFISNIDVDITQTPKILLLFPFKVSFLLSYYFFFILLVFVFIYFSLSLTISLVSLPLSNGSFSVTFLSWHPSCSSIRLNVF